MIANLVNQHIITSGNSTIGLGIAVDSFITIGSAFDTGDQIFYSLVSGNDREVGLGTYDSAGGPNGEIVRDKIFETLIGGFYTQNPVSGLTTIANTTTISVSPSIQALTTTIPSWKRVFAPVGLDAGAYAAGPTFAVLAGQVQVPFFDASVLNETNIVIPAMHDIAANTGFYLGIHWAPSDDTFGQVRWGIELLKAKPGDAFVSSSTVYIQQGAPGVTGQHMLAEFATPISMDEPSTIIAARLFRDAAHGGDLYGGNAGVLSVSAAYQSTYNGTPKKDSNHYDWS